MTPNKKNNQQEEAIAIWNSMWERILDIISQREVSWASMKLIKKHVLDLIAKPEDKDSITRAKHYIENFDPDIFHLLPEWLKRNKDVVKSAISVKPSIYDTLDSNMKNQDDIIFMVFDSYIQQNTGILVLMNFLRKFSWNKKVYKKLQDTFSQHFEGKHIGGLEKILYNIYSQNIELAYVLINSGIIISKGSGIYLSDSLLKEISKKLTSQEEGEKKDSIKNLLYEHLGLSEKKVWNIFEALSDFILVHIHPSKQELKKENEEWEKAEKQEEEISSDGQNDETTSYNDEAVLSNYTYSHYGASYQIYDSSASKSIKLSENELKSMSEKALERYIEFSNLLQSIGLWFLQEKHKEKIQLLTQVNFYSGEGMTDGKILIFLNRVAKNIWIPESSFEDENGNKKIWRYNLLWEAIRRFEEIASSWYVNDTFVCSPSDKWNEDIVEKFMKLTWIISGAYSELSVAMWK